MKMTNNRKVMMACALACIGLTACDQYKYNPSYAGGIKTELPDFSLHFIDEATIDFGKEKAGALVHIRADVEGSENVMNVFLDENGRFSGRFLAGRTNGNGNRKDIEEAPAKTASWKRTATLNPQHGYYCFEDTWNTHASDFDMNDVIVEYAYDDIAIQEYDAATQRTRCYMDRLVVNIKPRHCGTDDADGFCLQLPEQVTTLQNQGKIKSIRMNGGDDLKDRGYWKRLSESSTDLYGNLLNTKAMQPRFTYEFFRDIKRQTENDSYSLVIELVTEEGKSISPEEWCQLWHPEGASAYRMNDYKMRWGYNPYIIVHSRSLEVSSGNGSTSLEIHLPLYPVTESGMPLAGGNGNNGQTKDWGLWFVSAVNAGEGGSVESSVTFYPYALDIPYDARFLPSREGMKIVNSYALFSTWIKGGSPDWYTRPYNLHVQPFTLSKGNWIY